MSKRQKTHLTAEERYALEFAASRLLSQAGFTDAEIRAQVAHLEMEYLDEVNRVKQAHAREYARAYREKKRQEKKTATVAAPAKPPKKQALGPAAVKRRLQQIYRRMQEIQEYSNPDDRGRTDLDDEYAMLEYEANGLKGL